MALAAQGARVWLLARDPEKLSAAAALIENETDLRPETRSLDVADNDAVAAVFSEIETLAGSPAMVINSAGITQPSYFEDIQIETFHRIMAVNYFGVVHTTKAVLPSMRRRGGGHIVAISSLAGLLGVFGYTAYGASKFALRGFFDALRQEVAPDGVQLHAIYPPDVDTPMLEAENKYKPMETKILSGNTSVMSPRAVAEAGLRGIARNKYMIIPGFENKIIYFLSSCLMGAVHPIMDSMVARARQKMKTQSTRER